MNRSLWEKKVCLIVVAICCLLLLSGCSFSDLMSKGTGITNDPDYQTWEKLSESGKLDKEGKYTSDAIRVSFAANNLLNVHYYKDREMNEEFPGNSAYLFPGDRIYASVFQKDKSDGLYLFDRFDVVEYSADNVRGEKLDWTYSEDKTCLLVPYDFKGTEVSIEPIGHFGDRSMILNAYVSDKKNSANGKWKIDGEEIAGGVVALNPLDSCRVEYSYNPDEYYFVSSKPDCWKKDDDIGLVIFEPSGAKTGEEKYEVVLDSYITAKVDVTEGEIYGVESDTGIPSKQDNKTWNVSRLKGDGSFTVFASTKKGKNISSDPKAKPEELGETEYEGKKCYAYKMEIGDENEFIFIPSDYLTDHGKLKFIYNGNEINERIVLNSGNQITVEAAVTEDGYWLPDNGRQIKVKGKDTAAELKEIQFYPYRTVTVLLDKPAAGGTVSYYANGFELRGASAELYCGTRITVKAWADEDWDVKIDENDEYIVGEQNNQVVRISGKSANSFFEQKEAYKPLLKVRANSNLGSKCKITISAKDYGPLVEIAKGGTLGSDEHIGTNEDVTISFSSMDFDSAYNSVMLTVIKKVQGQSDFKEIHYVNKANGTARISFAKGLHYKEVNIEIKAVNGEYYQLFPSDNADIKASFSDVNSDGSIEIVSLTSDSFVTDDRHLEVTIKPHSGYTMVGSDTKNGIYSRKGMSYKDYKNQISKIISNQLRKMCTLRIDTDGLYGKLEYTVDGNLYTGPFQAIEGNKIRLSFKLKDDQYRIEYNNPDIFQSVIAWTGFVNNENNGGIEIPVTKDMDQTCIPLQEYFTIKKKEAK